MKTKYKTHPTALAKFTLGLVLLGSFGAVNLSAAINNGDFETGGFSGWTEITPFDQYLFVTGSAPIYGLPHSGNYFAVLSGFSVPFDSIAQTLPTVSGLDYDISFWVRTNGDKSAHADEFKATFGNLVLLDDTERAASDWTLYHFNATAASISTVLEFSGAIGNTYWALDDVSVVPRDAPGPISASAVPEPSSYGLLAIIMCSIAVRRRVVQNRTASGLFVS